METIKKLTIIIPVYNEIKQIEHTYREVVRLTEIERQIEAIFIDDASNDGTREFLQEKKNLTQNIKFIIHNKNKGYGAAIKTGIKNAVTDYIAITDADGTYPIHRITELFGKLESDNLDMIVGWRENYKDLFLLRNIAKIILIKLSESLSGESILDLNSGFRVFKKEIALKYLNFFPDGFSLTSTITLLMLANNYKIAYIPIKYEKRGGQSKINPVNDSISFLHLIIRTVFYFNPLKVLLILSGFFFFMSLVVLLGSYLFLGRVMDITTLILFTTGIHIMTTGLLADLINKRLAK